MKIITIPVNTLNPDGTIRTIYLRTKEWEIGDWIQINSSPGGRGFNRVIDYNHWSQKADGHYPVLIKIDTFVEDYCVVHLYIGKPHLRSTEMSVHHFATRYLAHPSPIVDHYCL